PSQQRVALLSDTHIAADPNRRARGVNMTNNLRAVTAEVLAWPQAPGAVFVNGDLAFDSGGNEDYAAVTGLLRPLREGGLPIHLGLGNHDNRERFWNVLRDDKTVPADLAGRQAAIVRTPVANWFLLDSLIQTRVTPGLLGEAQRAWLTAALDANSSAPAIVMIHHQPVVVAPGKKNDGLEDTAELLAILRPRRQVKAYFFGHTHHWKIEQDPSGIHLVNLPPVGYVFTQGLPSGWVKASIDTKGARLELRCVDHAHPQHGQVADLAWRDA
ncbi:MAG TPA: metallophosphoesterase, partial [Candidatus Saccharimonadales bacterium]|nr:metallophosphoesterase [Candidatus Saccharimonadales bacterium]